MRPEFKKKKRGAVLTTSINMHYKTRYSIIRAAGLLRTSQRDVVVLLLKRAMRDIDSMQGGFTTVKYQEHRPREEWHCFCIQYYPDEYEFFNDLRRLCKRSVSRLLAFAVKKYLVELLGKTENSIINYWDYMGYSVGKSIVMGIICWHFYWGDARITNRSHPPARILRATSPAPI
jgi:hypothetical protein